MSAAHAAGKAASRGKLDALPEDHLLARLIADHREFASLLGSLTREAARLRAAGDDDHDILCSILDAARHLRTFAGHCRREDELLMPALAERGFADMPAMWKSEHEDLGRKVNDLIDDARRALDGSPEAKNRVLDRFDATVRCVTDHIATEENVVFPLALTEFDDATWKDLARRARSWSALEQQHGIF